MNKLSELYYFYTKKGALETLKRIKQRYFGKTKFILFKRQLCEKTSDLVLDPSLRCVAGNLDLLIKERQNRTDLPREFYVDQTHGGNNFYFIYIKNKLAYIHWYFTKGEYSRFFDMQDETTVELNYNYTLPEHRGKRISSKSISYICADLKKNGFKTVVSAVSCGNILAINGLQRNKFTRIRQVSALCSFVKRTKI